MQTDQIHTIQAAVVGEAVAGESAKTRSYLEALINNGVRTTFDIAELLHRVKANQFYHPDFSTWQEYVSTLNIKLRKAQYLNRIVEVMDEVGVDRAKYEPLGIARLREITSLDPKGKWVHPQTQAATPLKDFILGFVEQAEQIDMDTLKQHIRTLKGITGDNDIVFRNFSVTRLVAEKTIDPAIAHAKLLIGSVAKDDEGISKDASDGAALEVLAVNFLLSDQTSQSAQTESEVDPDLEGTVVEEVHVEFEVCTPHILNSVPKGDQPKGDQP